MKRLPYLVCIGLLCFGLAYVLSRWAGAFVGRMQSAASDFVFVRSDGPRLGARPADSDIVLVLFDQKTALKRGYVHQYADDLVLYRSLIKAGAKVVFDTRMVASADEATFAELKPLLEGMSAVKSDGSLLRDIWLSSDLMAEYADTFGPLFVQNVINANPHVVPALRSRMYPLINFTSVGRSETAPLVIARQFLGLPRLSHPEIGELMRDTGMMNVWHQLAPDIVNEPPQTLPRSAYPLGETRLVWHPCGMTNSLVVPLAFWVSYDPSVANYRRYSYLDVMENAKHQDFANKIVIVGFGHETDPGNDTYEVPCVSHKVTAAEVVAAATQTVLDNRWMEVPPAWVNYLVIGMMSLGLALVGGYMRPLAAVLTVVVTGLLYYAIATVFYRRGWYIDCVLAPLMGLTSASMSGVYNAWLNLRARQRVVDLFGRYVPRAVVSQLMQKTQLEALRLGGTKRDVTVMFADIRGFTSFSEDLPPEEVIRQLNSLLQIMVGATFQYAGTLDKYIGDAILVLFNAPLAQGDHAQRAVHAALEIQRQLNNHATGLSVGIGLHRGEAVVGNIGTPERLEYTAIGSTVNIASRLCDTAKPGEIIASSAVLEGLTGNFDLEDAGPIQVKGIKQTLTAKRITPKASATNTS